MSPFPIHFPGNLKCGITLWLFFPLSKSPTLMEAKHYNNVPPLKAALAGRPRLSTLTPLCAVAVALRLLEARAPCSEEESTSSLSGPFAENALSI